MCYALESTLCVLRGKKALDLVTPSHSNPPLNENYYAGLHSIRWRNGEAHSNILLYFMKKGRGRFTIAASVNLRDGANALYIVIVCYLELKI